MELNQQVCSFDLAKRLKELGIKQQSYLWWSISHPEVAEHNEERQALEQTRPEVSHGKWATKDGKLEDISAFTVAELGEIVLSHHDALIEIARGKMFGGKGFEIPKGDEAFLRWMLDANSWAKMLIYLIEKKLITV